MAIGLGGSAATFINLPALLIVLVGTLFVVMMKFSLHDCLNAFSVASRAFKYRLVPPQEQVDTLVEMSKLSRKEGMLALERLEIDDPYLADAVVMLVDGMDRASVEARMSKLSQQTADRHSWGAEVFYAAADVAPAMGMIGTLIGLVQMLSNMDDPKSIGPAMAVALLTTLYGAVLANVFAKPIGDKLSLRKDEEARSNALSLDGILAIQDGLNYRIVETLLAVYLKPQPQGEETEEVAEASRAAA
ncbi:flagellar motor protein PomA [Halioglobus japonicus]|uniref:MotA/TolQ/ExbB proton channel family protein n=1 Tax=Halioglobus japonicus TaxID=930805 RepID=UPI0019C77040|nr:MotA/TolQ/ExbB proton channel family protein [Halioglobus japonicus]GHD14370.1 flagellar motor protein PomA [Halioglobus japonicus]